MEEQIPTTHAGVAQWERLPLKASRSWFTPDVELLERSGRRVVFKDVSRRPWPCRMAWSRGALKREAGALERLGGSGATPALLARVGDDGFIMEWIDASPLPRHRQARAAGLKPKFFRDLQAVVAAMHARGIAHGDLRRRNVLVGTDGQPRLIDFETAVHDGSGLLRRKAFRLASRVDAITVLKLFHAYFPHDLTDEERLDLKAAPWPLRIGRFLRQRLYRLVSPKLLKRRWAKLTGR